MDGKMVTISREEYDSLHYGAEENITVSLDRYKRLLEIEIRFGLLRDYVSNATYSVSREDAARYMGFELPKSEE